MSWLWLLGCRNITFAPEDVDALVHAAWGHHQEGDTDALARGFPDLAEAVGSLDERREGLLSPLSTAAVGDLRPDVDPAAASGVYFANRIDGCTITQLRRILAEPDQDALYTGVYDRYERVRSDDPDAWATGEAETLSWDLEYDTSFVGSPYTVFSSSLLRRVPLDDTEGVVARAHMSQPAAFENPNTNSRIDQDYHFEQYWPVDGGLAHVYAIWRDSRLLGIEDDNEGGQRLLLDRLADWDDGTEQLCAEGRP
jgi:hypothetical protein